MVGEEEALDVVPVEVHGAIVDGAEAPDEEDNLRIKESERGKTPMLVTFSFAFSTLVEFSVQFRLAVRAPRFKARQGDRRVTMRRNVFSMRKLKIFGQRYLS